jgi:hypothetical protein
MPLQLKMNRLERMKQSMIKVRSRSKLSESKEPQNTSDVILSEAQSMPASERKQIASKQETARKHGASFSFVVGELNEQKTASV